MKENTLYQYRCNLKRRLICAPTNNSSEQAIRMSTIFRKVTNGFRSEWAKICLLMFVLSLILVN
ncbi:MAG: hypothetical protein KAH84_05505, partial [Thiomargarita sp.]|nr:hypothetical protein [Thiomargarita sp.]